MIKKRIFRGVLGAALVFLTPGLATAQERASVVAVNYPLEFMAERLLGDVADVVFPVPQDQDPSFWRPSIADISMIQSADLILLNGAGFATWVDRVSLPRSRVVNTSAAIEEQFIVTKSITHSHGDGGAHSHEGLASYTWLDPSLAIAQSEAIAAAIVAKGLAPADDVARALSELDAEFTALDTEARAILSGLRNVPMIATHPRYQYFARRYDLSLTALEWEAGAMPSDAQIDDLRKRMDGTGARVVIWEAEPPAAALEMAADLGLQSVVFPPLAHSVEGRSFLEAFRRSLSAMADIEGR